MAEDNKEKKKSGEEIEASKKEEKEGKKPDKKSEKREDKEINKLNKKLSKKTEELDRLKKENESLKDQYLRKQADFENFRKRMFREKEESIKFANSSLLSDIISVIDDFERALQSSQESRDFDSFHSGVEIIEKQLVNMLDSGWGLKRFESVGEPFDPGKHEALMMEESEDYDVKTVTEVYVKGYILHDRVIRPAKVKVANPVAKAE